MPLLAEIVCKAITTGELVRSADDDAGDDSSRFIHGFLPILPLPSAADEGTTCPSQAEIANEPTNDDGGGDKYVDFTAPGTPLAALQSAVLGTLDPVVIGQAVPARPSRAAAVAAAVANPPPSSAPSRCLGSWRACRP